MLRLNSFLIEPRLRGLVAGSNEWFRAQQEILRAKRATRRAYEIWYREQLADLESAPPGGKVLEIGSGAGFLKELLPEAITSDLEPGISDRVVDARALPFADRSLRGIFLSHAFHHIPDVRRFLAEASRTLVPGGVVSMIEVARSPLSKLVFGKLHPEPYRDDAADWELAGAKSSYDSNQALSWIVFVRDRARFESEFPELRIERVRGLPWLAYLLSGGVIQRSLIPSPALPLAFRLDDWTRPLARWCGLHWVITLRKAGR
ncbi:MAG TPA: class I SAM-dependent methyltransferase [Bdellovibrionota bacterium]|nr:class I SAM-dependent methyltransferase [Bdellovibrionota bacterium]